MAKEDLGTVTEVHGSGIVETSKGKRASIKAEKGDKLEMDTETRKVTIKSKADFTDTLNGETVIILESEFAPLSAEELQKKYSEDELRAIGKSLKVNRHTKADAAELAKGIVKHYAKQKNANAAGPDIPEDEYINLNAEELAKTFNMEELNGIAKVREVENHSTMNEAELCAAIVATYPAKGAE